MWEKLCVRGVEGVYDYYSPPSWGVSDVLASFSYCPFLFHSFIVVTEYVGGVSWRQKDAQRRIFQNNHHKAHLVADVELLIGPPDHPQLKEFAQFSWNPGGWCVVVFFLALWGLLAYVLLAKIKDLIWAFNYTKGDDVIQLQAAKWG